MTVSPEVEELVRRAMLGGNYASEDAVLRAALEALAQRQLTGDQDRPPPGLPVSPLGARLREIRDEYLAGGGVLLTAEELDEERAQRRGQRCPGD